MSIKRKVFNGKKMNILRCKGDTGKTGVEICRRLSELIRYFARKGNKAKLTDILRDVYGCDVADDGAAYKTFQRDKGRVSCLFDAGMDVSIDYDRGERKYVLKSNAPLALTLRLHEEGALALAAGVQLSKFFFPEYIRKGADGVWGQLKEYIPEESLHLGEVLSEATTVALPVSKEKDDKTFEEILKALSEKKAVKVTKYITTMGKELGPLFLSPWNIYYKYHSWYVFGIAEGNSEPGPYRIDRMKIVHIMDGKPYQAMRDKMTKSDIEDLLRRDFNPSQPKKEYAVKLRIHPPFTHSLRQKEWFPGQKITNDESVPGAFLYEVILKGLDDVTRWIMRALDSFEILEPEELKEKVREKIETFQGRIAK